MFYFIIKKLSRKHFFIRKILLDKIKFSKFQIIVKTNPMIDRELKNVCLIDTLATSKHRITKELGIAQNGMKDYGLRVVQRV